MATWQVKKKGNEGNSNGTLLHLIRNLVDLYKQNGTSVNKKKTLVENNFFSRYIKQVLLDKNSLFSPETPVILSPGHIFSLVNYSGK